MKIQKKALAIHILFWLGYLALLIFVLSGRETLEKSWRISFVHLLPQIIIVYINTEWLIPRFFMRKQYVSYIGLVILCFAGLYLYYEFFLPSFLGDHIPFRPDRGGKFQDGERAFSRPEGWSNNRFMRAGMRIRMVFNFTQALALFFLSTAYKTFQIALKREKEATQLKNEHLHSELKFLKSQINPHFLFNALNNIYTLAVLKSAKTPEMILKLSEMLRYIIYDCNDDKVLLSKEIQYILNYVALQKLKDDGIQNISINIDKIDKHLMVAPMLLIPFIENSFKHSKIEDRSNGWIKIDLAVQEHTLHFEISNSMFHTKYTKDNTGGVGLTNVKKRLELIYPEKHELKIEENQKEFSVDLIIIL